MLRSSAHPPWRGLGPDPHCYPPRWAKVMQPWNLQHYRDTGEQKGVSPAVLDHAIRAARKIQRANPQLPVVLTLRHLSILADVPYRYLRKVVTRERVDYKRVLFRKPVPGRTRFREIHIPDPDLARVQRWVACEILVHTDAHSASYAYHPGSRPIFAAKRHCGCRWLLKLDLEDFFHSISERDVHAAFRGLGYPALLSFELARITTMIGEASRPAGPRERSRWASIPDYQNSLQGFLPQGAPTSPMLSNLVMLELDEQLSALAAASGFVYTRYADDLAFSTKEDVGAERVKQLKRRVLSLLGARRFRPNRAKTLIRGPGARRIVLGVLVDQDTPRLTRTYKDCIRQHLHYLRSSAHGPAKHAEARKTSVSTLYHHVRGRIAWAEQVEPDFGSACLAEFERVVWPPFDRRQ